MIIFTRILDITFSKWVLLAATLAYLGYIVTINFITKKINYLFIFISKMILFLLAKLEANIQ